MESSPANGGDEATGIQVDLDNPDSSKAVLRARPRAAAPSRAQGWDKERADTSAAVKKRIARLQSGFNQQLADQQAAHQRQLAELNSRLDKLSAKGEGAASTDEATHQKAMDDLQAKLEEAQERGDSKDAAKITREMSALEGKYWAAVTAKQTGTPAREEPKPNGAPPVNGDATQQRPTQRKPTKAGVAWAKANASWWDDTTDDLSNDARGYANAIHHRMLAEGDHDPETPEYFEIIRQQVAKRFPEIDTVSTVKGARRQAGPGDEGDDDDEEGTQQPARRGPASFPNRGQAPRGSDLATLTRADIKLMREVNLNPDNDKHVLQFLQSKREDAADA